jgi:enoyl-CoA hydratase/carnithine racemase
MTSAGLRRNDFAVTNPRIAAVQGMSYSAGIIVAVCSDFRVGSPDDPTEQA